VIARIPGFGHISENMWGVVAHWDLNFSLLWSPISPLGLASRFMVYHACAATRQYRAFSILDASTWNSHPSDLRSLLQDPSCSFYQLLKTFIFGRSWVGSPSEQ